MTITYSKPSDFIKAYINSYTNEALVEKVKMLYVIEEEEIQKLIEEEALSLDIFLSSGNNAEEDLATIADNEEESKYQQ